MTLSTSESSDYHAYLLRIWREEPAAPWRASLENAHTGERCSFATMELLFLFLNQQTQAERPPLLHHLRDSLSPAPPTRTK
jgi:hypothetical protein